MKKLLFVTIFLLTATVAAADCPEGDLNADCRVNGQDLRALAEQWLADLPGAADLDHDGQVGMPDMAVLAREWRHQNIPLVINEVMASNSNTISDPQNDFDDWIEIHNLSGEPISVAGMYLTDDLDEPAKWAVPSGITVPARGYLLIWADAQPGDRPGLHAAFRLNALWDQVGLFDTDGSTLIDSIDFGEQTTDISYGRDPNAPRTWRFFGVPTPGSQNVSVYLGFVADTKFSHDRGFYDSPFSLEITTATEGAQIYYTLDGSSPYNEQIGRPTGAPYAGPIPIAATACVRAVAIKIGWKPTNVDTQTYIFLDQVIHQPARPPGWPANWGHTGQGDYQMDPRVVNDRAYSDTIKHDLKSVPTLSLVMHKDDWFGTGGRGIYVQGERVERACSAELIFPDEIPGFQINCGVMIVGGSSTGRWKMDKLSMRLKFQGKYGASKLRFPVFGDEATDEFDTLVVDARMNCSWPYGGGVMVPSGSRPWIQGRPTQRDIAQYTRDEFVSDIQNATGGYAPEGRLVHLYLNGLYWGLYWVHERPDEHFAAAYFGGQDDDYDVLKHSQGRVIHGSGANYSEMFGVANGGLASDSQYELIQQYLDVPNLIDYMITNYYIGNTDWDRHNWYATRSSVDPSGLWRYHSWDAEHVMEHIGANQTGTNNSGAPTRLQHRLTENTEYRLLFADHVHRHMFNDGILTPQRIKALYQIRLDEADRAVVGESARWGDNHSSTPYTRDIHWVRERDWLMETYFTQRRDIVLSQFKSRGWYPAVDAPVFHVNGSYQHGGYVDASDQISMTAPEGTIWYTLDGSDPRISGKAPSQNEGITLVPENAEKRVLVPTEDIGDDWRGGQPYGDARWTAGTGGVGYERSSGYQALFDIDVGAEMYDGNTSCYIRIRFTLSADDLQDIATLTLRVRYDDAFVAYINGVEVARALFTGTPQWNSEADGNHSDSEAIYFNDFDIAAHIGALRQGDNILAIHGLNQSPTSSDFLISTELVGGQAGGPGTDPSVSPTAIRYTDPFTIDQSTHVKARVLSDGTWSALNEAVFAVGPVAQSLRISEVMYHPLDSGGPDDPNTEYIELTNVGDETINLNVVKFTNGVDFTFGDIDLASGAYTLVVKDTGAFTARYGQGKPIAGEYSGSLANNGKRIELLDAASQVIHNFRYRDNWYDITDGLGFSLTVNDPTAQGEPNALSDKALWRPSAAVGGSPGEDDSGQVPVIGDVVINEILTHSHAGRPDWIELHNTTNQAINIGGWFLSDDADNLQKYEIAPGTTIGANGYVVFYEDTHFGNLADPGTHQAFALSENGETLYLHSGADGELTGYSEQEKFGAAETGVSFGRYRKSTGTYNFVAMTDPTPGAVNSYPQVGPIVISEIMYNPNTVPDAEYVELLNISDTSVVLYDFVEQEAWRFTDDPDNPGIELIFPSDNPVIVAAGETILLVKDLTLFQARFTLPQGVQVFEWGAGRLANGNEKIQLSRPGDVDLQQERQWIRVDRVVYSDGSHPDDFASGVDPWPSEPDGQAQSLTRINPTSYGNDPANWRSATPTPGMANP